MYFFQQTDALHMVRPREEIRGAALLRYVPQLSEYRAVAGGGGGVAGYHDYARG